MMDGDTVVFVGGILIGAFFGTLSATLFFLISSYAHEQGGYGDKNEPGRWDSTPS